MKARNDGITHGVRRQILGLEIHVAACRPDGIVLVADALLEI